MISDVQNKLRLIFKRTLLLLAVFFIACLIADVVLRIYGFTYFNPYIVDPDVGFSLRPHAEGLRSNEGMTYIKIR
ncbi:MAG: hypothetical protein AUG51_19120 [Acidobacteria bacterium 13_1_20CM_3_53_8]|nr:MAG: hypothetical protein AUG51_19120 [Acidobacteria bacterium 13_1_20CM_3_53_8]